MGEKRQRTRIRSKIDELPEELKEKVNEQISDTRYTYLEISQFLKEQGYEISKSAVGRYALRHNAVTQRLVEAQEQTKTLVKAIQKNPDLDYTDAGLQILMDSLVKRISMAQEEFDNMPLDKAGRLITAISRTKAYKDKLKYEFDRGAKEALKILKEELKKELEGKPKLLDQLSILADKVAKRVEEENAK